MAADSDQLSRNGHGNFLRCNRADVEANRRVHAIEQMSRQALRLQCLKDLDHLSSRTYHADVLSPGLNGPAQYSHVVMVTARHDDNIGRLVGIELGHSLV